MQVGGPEEGLRVLVVLCEEAVDGGLQDAGLGLVILIQP
jgi:hypothetical protein